MSRGSAKPFNKRQNIVKAERNLFIGNSSEFQKFKRLMNKPINGKRYECNHGLQIRLMGDLNDVRKAAKSIGKQFGLNNLQDTDTSHFGVTKQECDKKNRNGRYCSDVITAYMYIDPKNKKVCSVKKA